MGDVALLRSEFQGPQESYWTSRVAGNVYYSNDYRSLPNPGLPKMSNKILYAGICPGLKPLCYMLIQADIYYQSATPNTIRPQAYGAATSSGTRKLLAAPLEDVGLAPPETPAVVVGLPEPAEAVAVVSTPTS